MLNYSSSNQQSLGNALRLLERVTLWQGNKTRLFGALELESRSHAWHRRQLAVLLTPTARLVRAVTSQALSGLRVVTAYTFSKVVRFRRGSLEGVKARKDALGFHLQTND